MRTRKTTVAMILAACVAFLVCAALISGVIRGSPDLKTDARGEIRKLLDAFFKASLRQEWDRAAMVLSDDFVMFTDGAQAFRKDEYVRLLRADDLVLGKYELRDMEVGTSSAGDFGWVTYRGYFESSSHGKPSRVETAETLLFRNEGGDWRMFHAQASIRDLYSSGAQDQ